MGHVISRRKSWRHKTALGGFYFLKHLRGRFSLGLCIIFLARCYCVVAAAYSIIFVCGLGFAALSI